MFLQYVVKLHGFPMENHIVSDAVNKCVELFLRCFTSHNPKNWSKFYLWAKYWYNTSFHISFGMTQFKAEEREQGHMAIGTNGYELRSKRREEKKPNKKYSLRLA